MQQTKYFDDASIDGGGEIPKNSLTAALKSLGATLHIIGFCLKKYQHN